MNTARSTPKPGSIDLRARVIRATILAAGLAAAALLPACARTMVLDQLKTDYAAGDTDKELEYWHSLPGRPVVSNNEGLHGLILFTLDSDKTGSYPRRVQLAKDRGWLPMDFDEPGELSMTRGTLARALAIELEIKGGVMMRVLGPIPRYAIRELIYLRIMADPSTENQSITGVEFVGVISKAQDYQMLKSERPPIPEPAGDPQGQPPAQPAPEAAAPSQPDAATGAPTPAPASSGPG